MRAPTQRSRGEEEGERTGGGVKGKVHALTLNYDRMALRHGLAAARQHALPHDLFLELDNAVDEVLGAGRAAVDVDVHRHDVVHALHDGDAVAVGAAGGRTA